MGTTTTISSVSLKVQREIAEILERAESIQINTPQEAMIYVLSHNCKDSPVEDLLQRKVTERERAGEIAQPKLWTQDELQTFSNASKAVARKIREDNNISPEQDILKLDQQTIDLPPGLVEAGLLKTLDQVTFQELKVILFFSRQPPQYLVALLERPELIRDLASGKIGLHEEMEDILMDHKLACENPNRSEQLAFMDVRIKAGMLGDLLHGCGVSGCKSCGSEEAAEHHFTSPDISGEVAHNSALKRESDWVEYRADPNAAGNN